MVMKFNLAAVLFINEYVKQNDIHDLNVLKIRYSNVAHFL